jgi:hypothetical protein
MRTMIAIAMSVVVAGTAAWAAAETGGEAVTATGEIVDLACYVPRGDKGRGAAHQECAEMCAKGGQPLGILGSDGQVLLLVEDHAKPAPYGAAKKLAGKQAKVSGQKFSRGGVNALVVTAAEAQ